MRWPGNRSQHPDHWAQPQRRQPSGNPGHLQRDAGAGRLSVASHVPHNRRQHFIVAPPAHQVHHHPSGPAPPHPAAPPAPFVRGVFPPLERISAFGNGILDNLHARLGNNRNR